MNQSTEATMILQAQKRPREIRVPADEVVRGLIAQVHASLTTKQRLGMIRKLKNELFQHEENLVHWFVELGGLRVLLLQLGLALDRGHHVSTVQEIHGLCHCLEQVLLKQSNNNARQAIMESIEEVTTTLDLLERACREWNAPQIPFVAHWISSCAWGTRLLWQAPVLLRCMVTLLKLPAGNTTNPQSQVLGFFKNVTYFDRQGRILGEAGFLHKLTTVTLSTTAEIERVSANWRNVALIHECRARLKEEVDMLHILYTQATTTDNAGTNVHRNVLNTAINLSMDQDFCVSFLLYGDGLYTALLQSLLMSDDSTTRKRAARTLRLWATHAASANLLVQASSLIGALSATAVRDDHADVRREAAEAFGRCASWIQAPMPQHQAVLEALSQLCRTAPPAVVARAIKGQAALPNNRSVLPDNAVLMESLVTIASQPHTLAREDACVALLHLTSVPENRSKLLSKPLLDALCLNLVAIPAAAEIVIHLAKDVAHLPMLVKHDQLLKALIRCAAQPNHPFKPELKRIILQLVEAL